MNLIRVSWQDGGGIHAESSPGGSVRPRRVMPLQKFWQIYQRFRILWRTRPLDELQQDVIELTGYKQMLEQWLGHEECGGPVCKTWAGSSAT